jgi:hypothetical protein
MTLRKGHGNGAGSPRVEVLPADELPSATTALAVRPDRDANGRFVRENKAQRLKVVRPGPLGRSGSFVAHQDFRPFQRWGRRYASHRRAELARVHGDLSAGVGAMIESAALGLAAARYLHQVAAETRDPALFKQASALAVDARQNELAAWELAARESKARPEAGQWSFATEPKR